MGVIDLCAHIKLPGGGVIDLCSDDELTGSDRVVAPANALSCGLHCGNFDSNLMVV